MADHFSDPALRDVERPSRAARTDWRLGGRTVRRWREPLLALALVTLAVVIAAAALVEWLWPSPLAGAAATALVWLAMAAVVLWGFTRSRPIGLLRFRALDVLYGVALGSLLRLVQGWMQAGAEGSAPFPSYGLVDGAPLLSWVMDVAGVVVIAPVLEELFFRSIILVALYTALRRPFGRAAAGTVSVIVSAGLFVLAHTLTIGADTSAVMALLVLGLVSGTLVVLTGRIWGAVLVHVVFNLTFVVLGIVGTWLI